MALTRFLSSISCTYEPLSVCLSCFINSSFGGIKVTVFQKRLKLKHTHTRAHAQGLFAKAADIRADLQDTAHVNTGVPQSTHQGTERHSVTAVIVCSVSQRAIQTN